jgi:hypothetical protein
MEMVNTLKRLMRSLFILVMIAGFASPSTAAVKFYAQDSQPATCTKGDMWTDTNATSGQRVYSCESTNTWVVQGVDLVGDCTAGPCLDGSSDGGNMIKLWAGTGSYWTALQGGAPAANRSWRLPIAAPPAAGATQVMTMDEYGQMAFMGLPDVSGKVLSSTTAGVLSWATAGTGGGGYTNLTSFVDQTAWRLFYSDSSGDVKELALGADGTYLKSNGASSVPSFATPTGSGDMVLATTQSVTGKKTFDDTMLAIKGSSTGVTTFDSANAGATNYTLNVPAANGTLATTADIVTLPSATEGQILQANSSGVYVSTSSFAGLINDAGTGTDDLWSASKIWGLINDTKGNGDTGYVWSADKVFDQLAGKQATLSAASTITALFSGAGEYLKADGTTGTPTGTGTTSGTFTFDGGSAATAATFSIDGGDSQ